MATSRLYSVVVQFQYWNGGGVCVWGGGGGGGGGRGADRERERERESFQVPEDKTLQP